MDDRGEHPGPGGLIVQEVRDPASGVVVRVAGELDISTVGTLESAIDGLVAERPSRVVFDLSELRFMDSSGIAVLLRANNRIGPVYLRNPSHIVARVIESTGLATILRTEP